MMSMPVKSFSLNDILNLTGCTKEHLYDIRRNKNRLLNHFDLHDTYNIHKSPRPITAAKKPLELVHKLLLNKLLKKVLKPHSLSFASKGIKQNLEYHSDNNFFLTIDIKNCFPSVSIHMVESLFLRNRFDYDASKVISDLLTVNGVLPQGFCTSPLLAECILFLADHRIERMARKMNVKYSRFVDDITFSSSFDLSKDNCGLYNTVKRILGETGFQINESKTADTHLSNSIGEPLLITKLRLSRNGIDISKKYYHESKDLFDSLLHFANGGPPPSRYIDRTQAMGIFYYVTWINPSRKSEFMNFISKIDWVKLEQRANQLGLTRKKKTFLKLKKVAI